MNPICFDLEGPLSPQDNAYDLMKLIPNGDQIFEVISRYDDLLTMEGRADYEPGDTLALIVPFLVMHNITEADIAALATRATLNDGALELISSLKRSGWEVFCITTTYEQYANHITRELGIVKRNVAFTKFRLDKFKISLCKEDTALLEQTKQDILSMKADDSMIKQKLDSFFWKLLPRTKFGRAIRQVKPVGGRRKVSALKGFSRRTGQPLSCWVVVGDSITDSKMLEAVKKNGGIAIAFNANEYALRYANVGLASINLGDLRLVTKAWERGGKEAVEKAVREKWKEGGIGDRNYFHWLDKRRNLEEPLAIHKRIRRLVREEAGKLG